MNFSFLLSNGYPQEILGGILTMFKVAVLSWIIAFGLGLLLSIIRMSGKPSLKRLVAFYVEYHQNVPMLVQFFVWYFGVPAILPADIKMWVNAHNGEFIFSLIALSLAMSSYFSEDIRGGIRAISKGQTEASRALGLTYLKTVRLVIFPQALRNALPSLVNHSVLLFKNTSLAMAIGLSELTYVTRQIESETFKTTEVYLFTTVVYLFISLVIMFAGSKLESHYQYKAK